MVKTEDLFCRACGYDDYIEAKRGPHIGYYCADCGAFIRWKKQDHNVESGEEASGAQNVYAYALINKLLKTKPVLTKRQAGAIISALAASIRPIKENGDEK